MKLEIRPLAISIRNNELQASDYDYILGTDFSCYDENYEHKGNSLSIRTIL